MKKILIAIILMCAYGARATGWITPYVAGPYLLQEKSGRAEIMVAVNLSGAAAANVSYQVLTTKLDSKVVPGYMAAFSVSSFVPSSATEASSVKIIVNMDTIRQAGTYELTLLCTDKVTQANTPQQIAITLEVPAATVTTTTPTLNVEVVNSEVRTWNAIMINGASGDIDDALKDLLQPAFSKVGIADVCSYTKIHTGGNKQACVTYELTKEFKDKLPLGVSNGTLTIDNMRMKTPLTIQVQVIRRLNKIWIVLFAVFGVLFGYLCRTGLTRAKSTAELKEKGEEQIRKMYEAINGVADDELNSQVKTLSSELKNKLNALHIFQTERDSKFNTALDDAITAFNKAKTEYDERLKTAKTAVDKLSNACNVNSPELKVRLGAATGILADADKSLKDGDPTAAGAKVKTATLEINKAVADTDIAGKSLIKDIDKQQIFPELTRPKIAELWGIVKPVVEAISLVGDDPVILVPRADELWSRMLWFVQQAGVLADKQKEQRLRQIVSGPVADSAKAEFEKAYKEWRVALEQIVTIPYNGMNEDLVTKVNELIAKLPKGEGGQYEGTGARAEVETQEFKLAQKGEAVSASDVVLSTIKEMEKSISTARKNWIQVHLVQLGLLCVMTSLVFFKAYQKDFIGDIQELVTIFLAAFGTDLTTDVLLQLAGKPKA